MAHLFALALFELFFWFFTLVEGILDLLPHSLLKITSEIVSKVGFSRIVLQTSDFGCPSKTA